MDDTVDELYSVIKFYLTQISREALSEREGRRWTDIVSFTINMEQIGDTVERVLQDVEDKKIRKNRSFSDAGMAEISHLHERLLANLRLADERLPRRPCAGCAASCSKRRRASATSNTSTRRTISRACRTTPLQSIETSSLHLDLISELKRINSHLCGVAYPILESAGALTDTRIRHSRAGEPRRHPAMTC